jgi:DNA-binding response OmpR family regulator
MAVRITGETVLIVEDPFVRAFVSTYLTRHGFATVQLEAVDAERRLRAGTVAFDLLITNRPAQFAGLANAPLLYLAAFPDPAETAGYQRSHMLRKPFRPEQLLAAVTALLGGVTAAG